MSAFMFLGLSWQVWGIFINWKIFQVFFHQRLSELLCENGALEANSRYQWLTTTFIACSGVCRLAVWHCSRSWDQVQGLFHVQVLASRLKECLPGAHPFLMVKEGQEPSWISQAHLKLLFRFDKHHMSSHSIGQNYCRPIDKVKKYIGLGGGDICWATRYFFFFFFFLKGLVAFSFPRMTRPWNSRFSVPFYFFLWSGQFFDL